MMQNYSTILDHDFLSVIVFCLSLPCRSLFFFLFTSLRNGKVFIFSFQFVCLSVCVSVCVCQHIPYAKGHRSSPKILEIEQPM